MSTEYIWKAYFQSMTDIGKAYLYMNCRKLHFLGAFWCHLWSFQNTLIISCNILFLTLQLLIRSGVYLREWQYLPEFMKENYLIHCREKNNLQYLLCENLEIWGERLGTLVHLVDEEEWIRVAADCPGLYRPATRKL